MDELNKVYQLNEYLKELEEGELGLERVTDPEIASLLKLAEHLQKNLPVASSPRFRQQAKENALAAWQKRRLNQRRRLAKIIALAAAFLLLLSSLASAAWRSKPGSLLYPVKRALQKIVTLASGNQKPKSNPKSRPENRKEQDKRTKPKNKKSKKKPKSKSQDRGKPLLPGKTIFHPTSSRPSSNRSFIGGQENREEEEDISKPNEEKLESHQKSAEPEEDRSEREEEQRD